MRSKPPKIAILDDYQQAALAMADWSAIRARARVDVFSDTLTDPDALVARLSPYEILCVMRERTPLAASLIARLPNLRLIVSTGPKNSAIDADACKARGIDVRNTSGSLTAPIELTWALIMASARNLIDEAGSLRSGGWQTTVGEELAGKTLGILGLGRIGGKIAQIARAFDMDVITWSERVSEAEAQKVGARRVGKDALFAQADILTIHLVLVDDTHGLVGSAELAQMKPRAWLVNTSRGPIVDEAALIQALRKKALGGAALDVFGTEPLPAEHPFRSLDNVLATPHLGYVSRQQYAVFYAETVRHIAAWLDGAPEAS